MFRGAATDPQYEARANTILHEMAHMWFGDLVTMRWWDDLWLKESFADYMGAAASAEATRWRDDGAVCQTDPRPHRLALGHCDFDRIGADRPGGTGSGGERTSVSVAEAPLVLLNDGDMTYAKAQLDEWLPATVQASLSRVADPLARELISAESLESVDRWLAGHGDAPAALRRLVVEQRDQLARAGCGCGSGTRGSDRAPVVITML